MNPLLGQSTTFGDEVNAAHLNVCGVAVALWLVPSTLNRAVRVGALVGALVGETVLCSSAKLNSHIFSLQPGLQMTSFMLGEVTLRWIEDQPFIHENIITYFKNLKYRLHKNLHRPN